MGAPVTKEEFISRHSAYFQGIGFDVQYVAFIYYMLDLGYEDVIHYECEDDFVISKRYSMMRVLSCGSQNT